VVVTANHFVLDGVAGLALALGAGAIASRRHRPVEGSAEPEVTAPEGALEESATPA
jgi:hypothetical protein